MCLRVPVARCCCRVGRYAPGTQLRGRLAAVYKHVLNIVFLDTQEVEVEPIPPPRVSSNTSARH